MRLTTSSLAGLVLLLTACSAATSENITPNPNPTKYQTGDWSCLDTLGGNVTAERAEIVIPRLPTSGNTFAVHLTEAYSNAVVGGVQIAACNGYDVACAKPIAQVQADDSGLAVLTLPGGLPAFEGYLRITGALPENDVFFAGRATAADITLVDVTVYTGPALDITAALAGETLDPQQGVVHVDAVDCSHTPAAAVSLTVAPGSGQPGAWIEYFVDDGAALTRDAAGTDVTGVAFVFGVAPGAIGISGSVNGAPLGESIGFARAGAVASLVMPARPLAGAPPPYTRCCVSGGVTACCSDLASGDLIVFDVPGTGVVPVGCWAGGSSGLPCTTGATCTMRRSDEVYTGTCGTP